MFNKHNNFKRIISISAAAVCMLSAIRIAPLSSIDTTAADGSLTAFEITEEMQIGWNLGNTLDATSAKANPGLSTETAWGNPKATQELIDAVKAKGFNTVRIPTTWYQHLDDDNNIDAEWLARVKEVVDYCYANDMYVILNLHHEEWVNRKDLGTAYDEMKPRFLKIWTQIANEFKDYDQHLIFESMNEPRAVDSDHEWWGPLESETDTINKLNADFVELIRSIESPYKDTRLLMIPGYCASSDSTIYSKIVVPDDDYVAVSIHAYSPYDFTMNSKEGIQHDTFTSAYNNELHSILSGLQKTFTDKDIPVVIGEFGASNFENTEARCEWANAYISTTKKYGIPCVLWDNNVIKNPDAGEAHGYLNRGSLTWYEQSEPVIDEMMKVLADDSIEWGSERKAPVIEHDDIDSGKLVFEGPVDLDKDIKDGNCTPGLNVTWAELEGNDVAIQFTGDAPIIALTNGEWLNWTEVKPYDVDEEKGIAYYSSTAIADAWGEDAVNKIAHLFARTNSKTTVIKIAIIGASGAVVDPPEDEAKIFKLDLKDVDREGLLVLHFEGTPGAFANGCVGYMGAEDWEQIPWEGTIGADGILYIQISMTAIPENVTSAEAQVWWCDDEIDLVDYAVIGEPGPIDPPDEGIAGDANCDNEVTMADAVLIMQALANPDKYGQTGSEDGHITEQGWANGDVCDNDGLTTKDALGIQMYLLQLVDSLPIVE